MAENWHFSQRELKRQNAELKQEGGGENRVEQTFEAFVSFFIASPNLPEKDQGCSCAFKKHVE